MQIYEVEKAPRVYGRRNHSGSPSSNQLTRHTSAEREREARRAGDRPTKNRREGWKRSERGVREKESFLLKSTGGKSTPLLRSPPDRAEPPPPPGRTTPSLAPDTANDAIPARAQQRQGRSDS